VNIIGNSLKGSDIVGENKSKIFSWSDMPKEAQNYLGEDFWGEINRMIPRPGPSVDIYRTDREVVVVIEAPGLKDPSLISIKIRGFKLLIEGEIPWSYPAAKEELIQKERFLGYFRREIKLPGDIDPEGSYEAQFRLGLIELHIPRMLEEREVKICFEEDA